MNNCKLKRDGENEKMKTKIIYSDDGRDKAISGDVMNEDEHFIEVRVEQGMYRIAKRSIVCVKQRSEKNGKHMG